MAKDNEVPVPTEEDIVGALSRTGFIFEHRVAQILREDDFETDLNYAFPDPETGKSREADVVAYKELDVSGSRAEVTLVAEAIVECKSSMNPLVLVGETNAEYVSHYGNIKASFDPLMFDFTESYKDRSFQHNTILAALNLGRLPGLITTKDFLGRQLVRMNLQGGNWRADNSSIYDGILYPLAKALKHRSKSYVFNESEAAEQGYRPWSFRYIYLPFALIVTAGPVFSVDIAGEQPKVKQVGWAALRRAFGAKDIQGDLYVEVISFDHLNQYLESRIDTVLDYAREVLATNMHLYNPTWLLENLGMPKNEELFQKWLDDFRS
jgi:hypothetical protein